MTVRRALPRTALAALAVCAVAVGGGALAWACTPSATIDVSGSGAPGSSFTVNGKGFGSSATVSIFFDGQAVGSAQASAEGVFTTSATVPASATAGDHTVVATNPEGHAGAPFRVTGASPNPGPAPGGGGDGPGAGAPGGAANGGSSGAVPAPGSSSGRADGGKVTGSERESSSVRGGSGSRAAERGSSGAIGDPTLATDSSGATVFADSLGTPEAARKAAGAKAASERSASGDLWGGFASDGSGARGGFDGGSVPANGPGSALTLSLVLGGLGLTALMAGGGATALRRRRAMARRSSG